MERIPVLCVDDEPRVLGGLSLQLRRHYDVTAAHSGAEALDLLQRRGPFWIVLSDMRMPSMNGAQLLAHVRVLAPDTVRMLLTGQADLPSAIAAINDGQIFRFLTKPCPPDQLRQAFDAAADQYRLVTAQRVLLEQTLHGSVRVLVDVLSLVNPAAFGRAQRLERLVDAVAQQVGVKDRWALGVAALLSQLGHVALPAEVAERLQRGEALAAPEQRMVARVPEVTERLLAHIPRLEPVRTILAAARRPYPLDPLDPLTPDQAGLERGGQILKAAIAFDRHESRGLGPEEALAAVRDSRSVFDPDVLDAVPASLGVLSAPEAATAPPDGEQNIAACDIRPGMILAEDVRLTTGVLIVARGYRVTESLVERLGNYPPGSFAEPLVVTLRAGGRL